jgi:DNA end-binding protein Ku
MPRSTASATITFGLVSIPVKFYTATASASESVTFNQLTPKGNRVRQRVFDAVTGEEVQRDQLDKGYEFAKDQFVRVTKDELKALEAECESKTVDIVEFVEAASVDPLWVEKTYFLGPDKGAEKGYLLLSEAMTANERVAVAQWNARGKEHLVVIRPYKGGLVLHVMYYASEIHSFDEIKVTSRQPISAGERAMAGKLLQSLSSEKFDQSKYQDHYAARVRKAIDEKIAAGDGGTFKTATITTPTVSAVLSLEDLLAKSLDTAAKKKS